MTQTIDIAHAKEPELRRWLAELPCHICGGEGFQAFGVIKESCSGCEGDGLALPWASEPCQDKWHTVWHERMMLGKLNCPSSCNGFGRVPKAVGLEELHAYLFTLGHIRIEYDNTNKFIVCCVLRGEPIPHASTKWVTIAIGGAETSTLSALRAVAERAKAGIR